MSLSDDILAAISGGSDVLGSYYKDALYYLRQKGITSPSAVATVVGWFKMRNFNQSVELARAGKALAGAAIMRQALEEIAQPHGCGCPEICHCFSGEGGREIADAMRKIASDALKNAPLIEAVKPFQLPAELIGTRVGGFTLAQAPEGVKSQPTPARGREAALSEMSDDLLIRSTSRLLKECNRRGISTSTIRSLRCTHEHLAWR